MKNTKAKNTISFFTQNKKLIFILLYLIILPILSAVLIYSITYFKGRPKLFLTNQNDQEKYVAVSNFKSYKKSKYANFEISLDYKKPIFDHDKKIIETNGQFKFNFKINFKNDGIKYVDNTAKIKVEADTFWKSNKLTDTEKSLSKSTDWDKNKSFRDVNSYMTINKYFPIKPIFLINIDQSDYYIFIKFSFKVELPRPNETEEIVEYLKISPRQWKALL